MIFLTLYLIVNGLAISNAVVMSSKLKSKESEFEGGAILLSIGRKAVNVFVLSSDPVTSNFAISCLSHQFKRCESEHLVQTPILEFICVGFALHARHSL